MSPTLITYKQGYVSLLYDKIYTNSDFKIQRTRTGIYTQSLEIREVRSFV